MKEFNLEELYKNKSIAKTPLKILVYGENGVGKSTFASQAPDPIFMDLEGNIDHIKASKQPLDTWDDCKIFLTTLLKKQHKFKTLVIDSLEALEQKIWDYTIQEHTTDKIKPRAIDDSAALGYGKGYSFALARWNTLIHKFLEPLRTKGMNIILIGHSGVRRHEVFGGASYDRCELRINSKAAGLICDWCHCVLLGTSEVRIHTDWKNKKFGIPVTKAELTGKRIMKTIGDASFVAKNSFNLDKEMPLNWKDLEEEVDDYYEKETKVSPKTLERLNRLIGLKFNEKNTYQEFLKSSKEEVKKPEEISEQKALEIIELIKEL